MIIILIIIHHQHYHYLDNLNLGMDSVLERGGRPGPLLIPLIPIITRPRLKMNSNNFDHGETLLRQRESILDQAELC